MPKRPAPDQFNRPSSGAFNTNSASNWSAPRPYMSQRGGRGAGGGGGGGNFGNNFGGGNGGFNNNNSNRPNFADPTTPDTTEVDQKFPIPSSSGTSLTSNSKIPAPPHLMMQRGGGHSAGGNGNFNDNNNSFAGQNQSFR